MFALPPQASTFVPCRVRAAISHPALLPLPGVDFVTAYVCSGQRRECVDNAPVAIAPDVLRE